MIFWLGLAAYLVLSIAIGATVTGLVYRGQRDKDETEAVLLGVLVMVVWPFGLVYLPFWLAIEVAKKTEKSKEKK